jgi:competence protein ComEA
MKNLKSLILATLALGLFLPMPSAWSAPPQTLSGMVNLNTDTAAELIALPGIGPAKAAQIITYRQTHPFQSLEDLKKIGGLGPKRLEALRPHLSFIGVTAAKPAVPTETQVTP